jgi:hypothetical protein
MPSDLNPDAVTTALDCPGCGAPMEIIDRFTLYGVPEPVEHVKVRCIVGHWYTIPTDWLARGPQPRRRGAAQEGTGADDRAPTTPSSRS